MKLLLISLLFIVQYSLIICNNCTLKEQKCTKFSLANTFFKSTYSPTETYIRAVILLGTLFYSFVGISVICDKFMESIEVITSMEREIQYRAPDGNVGVRHEQVWNATVANLTLMALGSSAPEVLLAVIEIGKLDFIAGDLGPGTILGSAAFNLFVICGICILVIPRNEIRRLENMNVFLFTAFSSIFAYIWLHMITVLISPGEIHVWESLVTLMLFPATVVGAYILDIRFQRDKSSHLSTLHSSTAKSSTTIDTFSKNSTTSMFRSLMQNGKNSSEEIDHHSKAFYQIRASKFLKRSKLTNYRKLQKTQNNMVMECIAENSQYIRFNPRSYIVHESDARVDVIVERGGYTLSAMIEVTYYTMEDTAIEGLDFIAKRSTIKFMPFQKTAIITIKIIDDDIYEVDESFTVHIDSVKPCKEDMQDLELRLVNPTVASIFIMDDDHPGVFGFFLPEIVISEIVGFINITVRRIQGSRGDVFLPFRTEHGTAFGCGRDYIDQDGILYFKNNEHSHDIKIKIVNTGDFSKNAFFFVKLSDPYLDPNSKQPYNPLDIEPELGYMNRLKINITESAKHKEALNRLVHKATYITNTPPTTLMDQIKDALSPIEEGDETEEELEELPSSIDYFVHFVSLFWKVLFAFVPPPKYMNGWASFISSIVIIGLLTAWVADLATGFGCVLGLLDEVTSLTFVALGTSIPDTFASKLAAINEPTADASIGNVTGSNAVNVYLGLGVAWVIATLVNWFRGMTFKIHMESTSVTIVLFCFFSTSAVCILIMRRHSSIGGELGGPTISKVGSAFLLFALYLAFIITCSLKSYCIINLK